jgi:hypothetical protein
MNGPEEPLEKIILPLLHTRLSPPPEVCYNPEQAAHYHNLGFYVRRFFSDPALGRFTRQGNFGFCTNIAFLDIIHRLFLI